MKKENKSKGQKWDGKSRVSNETYRKNWDEIFKKNLQGTILNIEESYKSPDFYEETQKEKKELEESYKESLRQTNERKKLNELFEKGIVGKDSTLGDLKKILDEINEKKFII